MRRHCLTCTCHLTSPSSFALPWFTGFTDLLGKTVLVIGASETGKSTICKNIAANLFNGLYQNLLGNDEQEERGGFFGEQCKVFEIEYTKKSKVFKPNPHEVLALSCDYILGVPPSIRQGADFIFAVGVFSKRDVERLFSTYEKYMPQYDKEEFSEMFHSALKDRGCFMLDVSAPVRQGLCDAKVFRFSPVAQ